MHLGFGIGPIVSFLYFNSRMEKQDYFLKRDTHPEYNLGSFTEFQVNSKPADILLKLVKFFKQSDLVKKIFRKISSYQSALHVFLKIIKNES